jgi:hypothetical protein
MSPNSTFWDLMARSGVGGRKGKPMMLGTRKKKGQARWWVGSEQPSLRTGEPVILGERLGTNCQKRVMCSNWVFSTISTRILIVLPEKMFIRCPRRDLETQIEPMTHHYWNESDLCTGECTSNFHHANKFSWNSVDFMGSMDSESNLQKVSHQVLYPKPLSSHRKYIYVH